MTMAIVILLFIGFIIAPVASQSSPDQVPITYVENATARGAVCLDGTSSAYYIDRGEGDGVDNWLIFLQGGGWCSSKNDCKKRSKTYLGSSICGRNPTIPFNSVFSRDSTENPEFYNWNRVYVIYCDGSSFTGDIEEVDRETNVTYRGGRIFKAVMEDLLVKGMKYAKNAILSGSSAGGLATMIHCDYYRELLPITARVKCLAIASYFIYDKNLNGSKVFEHTFEALVTLHGSAKFLHPLCTSIMSPSFCFYPQYFLGYAKTPIFIAMSSFDQYQISFNLFYEDDMCLVNQNCTADQMEAIQELRCHFLYALPKSIPLLRGIWITSCIAHDLSFSWTLVKKMKILYDKTFPEAFNDWYFDRGYLPMIDTSEDPKNYTSMGIIPQSLN